MNTKPNIKPQVVIHLERDIHGLLKKAAAVEGRTLKRQAEYILRSRLAPLLTAAQDQLPAQKVLPWRKKP